MVNVIIRALLAQLVNDMQRLCPLVALLQIAIQSEFIRVLVLFASGPYLHYQRIAQIIILY